MNPVNGNLSGYISATSLFIKPLQQLDQLLEELNLYKNDVQCGIESGKRFAHQLSESSLDEQSCLRLVNQAYKMAKNEATRHGLLTCAKSLLKLSSSESLFHFHLKFIDAIVRTMRRFDKSNDIQLRCSLILRQLVRIEQGAVLIKEALPIVELVKMLGSDRELTYTTSLYLINQLMSQLPEEVRPEVRQRDGHMALARLLSPQRQAKLGRNVNWLIVCLDALRMTVYGDVDSKIDLLSTSIHSDLCRLARLYHQATNVKVAYNLARLITVLSACDVNKEKLVEAGAVEVLTPLLAADNQSLQLESLWAIRNISGRAYHHQSPSALISCLVGLLASQQRNVAISAAGCLCNLTCQNAQNKGRVVENDGIRPLCQLLMLNLQCIEIVEPICSALRHCTHRHQYASTAIYEIRVNKTLPSLVDLLKQPFESVLLPIFRSIVGLVSNLLTDQSSRLELIELDIARPIARLFIGVNQLLQRCPSQGSLSSNRLGSESTAPCLIEGVNVENMLELCIIALHLTLTSAAPGDETAQSNDKIVLPIVDQLVNTVNFLTRLVQVIYSTSQALQKAGLILLSQLAVSKREAAMAIQREGACPRLTELLQSDDEGIAAHSASTLYQISATRSQSYRRRLSVGLKQSLVDAGLVSDNGGTKGSSHSATNTRQYQSESTLNSTNNVASVSTTPVSKTPTANSRPVIDPDDDDELVTARPVTGGIRDSDSRQDDSSKEVIASRWDSSDSVIIHSNFIRLYHKENNPIELVTPVSKGHVCVSRQTSSNR